MNHQLRLPSLKAALLALMVNIFPLAGEAQSMDVNAPYDDAYDVLRPSGKPTSPQLGLT